VNPRRSKWSCRAKGLTGSSIAQRQPVRRLSLGTNGAVREEGAAPHGEGSGAERARLGEFSDRGGEHCKFSSAHQEAPLTPNDLLKGAAYPPDTPVLDGGLVKEGATTKQWRIARMLRDRFWKTWVLEYLPTLTRREKWCRREEPIRRGDIVFVCDPAVPWRDWRRDIVEEAFAGVDREVRRARVRIMDEDRTIWIMRPASKLAVLDLSEDVLHGGGEVAGR